MSYQKGDQVIHRSMGMCEVLAVEEMEYMGSEASLYYKIKGLEMTTWVPVVEGESASLRTPITPDQLDGFRATLGQPGQAMEPTSYKRHPGIQARLKVNTFQAMCELYRDLMTLRAGHSLSVSEKDILQRLRIRLVAEWASAAGISAEQAGDEIDRLVNVAV